jgi:phosphopantothenate-cysteine ligase
VGFKLLDGVSRDTLIDTAYELLRKNRCEYVLANNAEDIRGKDHTGYLVDRDKNVQKYEGKDAIAKGIAAHILVKLKGAVSG